jgi:hypothetical protein
MASIYNIEFNDTHENIIRKINNNFKALSVNLTKKAKQRIRINTDTLVDDINEALDLIEQEIDDESDTRQQADNRLSDRIDDLFPIGSVFITTVAGDPSGNLGGTWTLVNNAFALSATETGYVYKRVS